VGNSDFEGNDTRIIESIRIAKDHGRNASETGPELEIT
jgi:hypothetical protein